MQNQIDKIKSLVGFSLRSKTVIYGFDNVKTTKKKQKLIIACSTITDKNLAKLVNRSTYKHIPIIKLNNEITLKDIILKENIKVIGLLNENLADAILKDETEVIFKLIKEVQ